MLNEKTVEMMNFSLKDYYICYFDILGYKDYMDKNPDKHSQFLFDVITADADVQSVLHYEGKENVGYRIYSDNFLLYIEKELMSASQALALMSQIARKIQARFLMKHKIVVRGGITLGEFFADDRIVFGQGLITAVELEGKKAIYPRIILDKKVFSDEKLLKSLVNEGYIKEDIDGLYYINYFHNEYAVEMCRGACLKLVDKYCKYHPTVTDEVKVFQATKTIDKYAWLLAKYNDACTELNLQNLEIKYEIRLNKRLLKAEIIPYKNKKENNK